MKGKFLSLGTVDTVGLIILWGWGGCPGPCRTFSSIPGLYPLGDNQKGLQTLSSILSGGEQSPLV